jgi:hypothetical protein
MDISLIGWTPGMATMKQSQLAHFQFVHHQINDALVYSS